MTTATFNNRGVDYTIDFDITPLSFNVGPGSVGIDASRSIASIRQNQPWQQWLTFSTKSSSHSQAPAWGFSADRLATSFRSITVSSTSDGEIAGQQIGFIQTVERLEYTAQYQGIQSPFVLVVINATDVNPHATDSVPMPWYSSAGRQGGPQPLVPQQPITPPTIDDSPEVTLRAMGHLSRSVNPLHTVNANGSFLIWLVVKHEDDPGNQMSSLQFLYHLRIEFSRSWFYNNTPVIVSPGPINFTPSGSQHITHQGAGRGPFTPVFSDRRAYEHLRKEMDRLLYPRS